MRARRLVQSIGAALAQTACPEFSEVRGHHKGTRKALQASCACVRAACVLVSDVLKKPAKILGPGPRLMSFQFRPWFERTRSRKFWGTGARNDLGNSAIQLQFFRTK